MFGDLRMIGNFAENSKDWAFSHPIFQRQDPGHELGLKVPELKGELGEARQQQAATSEIPRIISSSPKDAQPIFDMVVRSAQPLLGGLSHIEASHRRSSARCIAVL